MGQVEEDLYSQNITFINLKLSAVTLPWASQASFHYVLLNSLMMAAELLLQKCNRIFSFTLVFCSLSPSLISGVKYWIVLSEYPVVYINHNLCSSEIGGNLINWYPPLIVLISVWGSVYKKLKKYQERQGYLKNTLLKVKSYNVRKFLWLVESDAMEGSPEESVWFSEASE